MHIYSKMSKNKDTTIDVVLKSVNPNTVKGLLALSIALFCLAVSSSSLETTYTSLNHLYIGISLISFAASAGTLAILFSERIKRYSFHLSALEKNLTVLGERFLKFNNLYITTNEKIVDCVHFQFNVDPDKIQITLKSFGSKFADSIRSKENELSDLMGLELVDKKLGIDDVTYIFRCRKLQPLSYAFAHWDEVQKDSSIPLDSERYWAYDQIPHGLISGSTGSGKTYLIFHIICMLVKQNAEIIICDPKKSDLYSLRNLNIAQIKSIECEPGPICKILRETVEEMNQRYLQMQGEFGKSYRDLGFKPKFIIMDEIAAFVASLPRKTQDEFNGYLRELVYKGRQAGFYIIIAVQKPEAEAIPTSVRDQLGLRVALGRMSPEGYRMVFGIQDLAYRSCPPGSGYLFIHDQTMSIPQLFQAPRICPLWAVIDEIQRSSSRLGDSVPKAERAD